jgi:tetratricopeptide (TPR) repeat protein
VLEGDVEASRKNLKGALAAYQAGLKKANPQEASTRACTTHGRLGQAAEAEQFAQRWMAEHPQDAVFPFYLADRALAEKDLATAEARYRKVIELQPNNALALNNVAWLLVQQAKPGAVEFAEKANKLLPGRPPLMDTLATALAAEKQLPRALELQKQAVEKRARRRVLRMNLAKLYMQATRRAWRGPNWSVSRTPRPALWQPGRGGEDAEEAVNPVACECGVRPWACCP